MTPPFDPRHIRRAFSRAARTYHTTARLQHEIEARLLDSLLYLELRPRHRRPSHAQTLAQSPDPCA